MITVYKINCFIHPFKSKSILSRYQIQTFFLGIKSRMFDIINLTLTTDVRTNDDDQTFAV